MANADWNTVEISDLSERNREAYLAAKEAYKVYKATRERFEQAMQDDFAEHLPAGHELKFGYNFGKLSIAVGPARERKAAKPTQSLASFLAGYSASGRAV